MAEVSKGIFSSVHVDADHQVQVVTVIHDKSSSKLNITGNIPGNIAGNIPAETSAGEAAAKNAAKSVAAGEFKNQSNYFEYANYGPNTLTVSISNPNSKKNPSNFATAVDYTNSRENNNSKNGATSSTTNFNYYVNLNSSRNWNQPNPTEILQRLKKAFKFLFSNEFGSGGKKEIQIEETQNENSNIPANLTASENSANKYGNAEALRLEKSGRVFQSNFYKKEGNSNISKIQKMEEILTPIFALDILHSFDLSLFHVMGLNASTTTAAPDSKNENLNLENVISNVLDDLTEFITTSNSKIENSETADLAGNSEFELDGEIGLLSMTKFKLFKSSLKSSKIAELDLDLKYDLDLTPLAISVLLETGNLDEKPAKTITKYLVEKSMEKFQNFEKSILKNGASAMDSDDECNNQNSREILNSESELQDFDPVEYCNLIRLTSQLGMDIMDFDPPSLDRDLENDIDDPDLDFFEEIQDFLFDFLDNKLYLEDEDVSAGKSENLNDEDTLISFSPDAFLYFLSRAVSTNNSSSISDKLIDLLTDRILARLGFGTCLGFGYDFSKLGNSSAEFEGEAAGGGGGRAGNLKIQTVSPIDLSMRILSLHHLGVLEKKSVKSCIMAGELKSLMKLQSVDGSWPEDRICRLKGGGAFGGAEISTLFAMQALYVIQQGASNGGF